MEYRILFTILAIATIFLINFSTALAMEEKSEYELPESGRIITFGDNAQVSTSGGLDPPSSVASPTSYDARAANRFEMGESGIIIDFNASTDGAPSLGSTRVAPFDPPRAGPAASASPAFEAYELPESGRLIVFPRQVELRREQAIRMQVHDRTVSDKR
jgi:hypothetical protein